MADPVTPSPEAIAAARYLRMVGATRRRPRPQPRNDDPMPVATPQPDDEAETPGTNWSESILMGPQGQGPDENVGRVIEVPEIQIEGDPDAYVEPFSETIQHSTPQIARDAQQRHRYDVLGDATPNETQHAFVDREHATPYTATLRGLGQFVAGGGGMDEAMGALSTIGDVIYPDADELERDEPNYEWNDRERARQRELEEMGIGERLRNIPEIYRDNQARYDQAYEDTAEDQPEFYNFGQGLGLVGALRSPAGPVAQWIGRAPTWLGRTIRSGVGGTLAGFGSGMLSSEHPFFSREGSGDALTGAATGGVLGTTFAGIGEGIGALRRTLGAGRAVRETQDELAARSRRILEGDEPLPDFSGTPIDDLDVEDALTATNDAVDLADTPAATGSTPTPQEGMSIRSLVTEPLRADPNVQRLRSAGLVTIPQARAVSRQQGGIEAFADDLDRAGVSQRGELLQTDTGVARAERLRDRALAQRQRVMREAEELGVSVSAEDLASSLRARANRTRRAVGPSARTNAAHIDQIADEIQSLPTLIAMEDEVARTGGQGGALGKTLDEIAQQARHGQGTALRLLEQRIRTLSGENATPADLDLAHQLSAFMDEASQRPITMSDLETQIQEVTRHARFDRNRGEAILSPQIQTARSIRGEMTDARIQALEAANAELARQFRNAQRGYQLGVTLAPRDAASRAQLGEMNRSLSLGDMQLGIAGAAAGGPVGGVGLTLAGRAYRRMEPSIFATINEGAILRARASQGQLSESAARMLGYLERSPDAFGRSGQVVINAAARGPAAVEAAFHALVGSNAAARAAAQDMDEQAHPVDPLEGLVDDEESDQVDPLEGL